MLFLIILFMSCSGNSPVRHKKVIESATPSSFTLKYEIMPHDSFPLHYSIGKETPNDSSEVSYSFVKNYGDSVVWEEGLIRLP